MDRVSKLAAVLAVCALVLPACKRSAPTASTASAPKTAAKAPAAPAGTLKITGTVTLKGTPPAPVALNRGTDPFCAKVKMTSQKVLVKGGGLANVVVYIAGQGLPQRPATAPVTVDQKSCMYAPRVQCATVGQKVVFENSDQTMHNVHAYLGAGKGKTLFNDAQLGGAPAFTKTFGEKDALVHMTCDIHPWMSGYLFVSGNGYCTVTDADGHFSLGGLPAGTYTVTTWHEVYGRKTWQVKVAPKTGGTLAATYEANPGAAK